MLSFQMIDNMVTWRDLIPVHVAVIKSKQFWNNFVAVGTNPEIKTRIPQKWK